MPQLTNIYIYYLSPSHIGSTKNSNACRRSVRLDNLVNECKSILGGLGYLLESTQVKVSILLVVRAGCNLSAECESAL